MPVVCSVLCKGEEKGPALPSGAASLRALAPDRGKECSRTFSTSMSSAACTPAHPSDEQHPSMLPPTSWACRQSAGSLLAYCSPLLEGRHPSLLCCEQNPQSASRLWPRPGGVVLERVCGELCIWVRADVRLRPALPGEGHCRQAWQVGKQSRRRYGWCWVTFLMFALCSWLKRGFVSNCGSVALCWLLGGCGGQCRALLEVDTGVSSIPVLTESQNG